MMQVIVNHTQVEHKQTDCW